MKGARPHVSTSDEASLLRDEVARLSYELANANALIAADSALRATLYVSIREANEQLLLNSLRADTVRKQADAERQRSNRRANGAFLAALGHELRGSVGGLVAALKTLGSKVDAVSRSEWELAEGALGNLRRLVDTLVDTARVYRGRAGLKRRWVRLGDALSHASASAAHEIESRGHLFETTVEQDDLTLYVDPDRLIQALSHLLDNAARYTPDGGLIRMAVRRDGAQIVFEVADNGVGITAGLREKLFEMFVQGDRYPRANQRGLGLGLALVRGVAELHGGTVTVHSAGSGRGSMFSVRIPIGPAAPPAQKSGSAE